MKVIFSKTLLKKEKVDFEEKKKLLKVYAKGVFTTIKGDSLPKYSSLIKIYMTMVSGARRAVFLVDTRTKDGFFLFFRSKNDLIGKNITIKNHVFKQTLREYLQILKEDIRIEAFEEFEIKKRG